VGSTDDEPLEDLEQARAAALGRLELGEADVPHSSCVPVFVSEGPGSFQQLEMTPVRWADGCAAYDPLEDLDRTIYITHRREQSLASLVRHEIAHVFVGEVYACEVPTWAVEGVACYAEGDDAHESFWRVLAEATGSGKITLERLNQITYFDLTTDDAYIFYARSYAAFDVLVQKTRGVRNALRVATAMGCLGPKDGLARSSIDLASFDLAVDARTRSGWADCLS